MSAERIPAWARCGNALRYRGRREPNCLGPGKPCLSCRATRAEFLAAEERGRAEGLRERLEKVEKLLSHSQTFGYLPPF